MQDRYKDLVKSTGLLDPLPLRHILPSGLLGASLGENAREHANRIRILDKRLSATIGRNGELDITGITLGNILDVAALCFHHTYLWDSRVRIGVDTLEVLPFLRDMVNKEEGRDSKFETEVRDLLSQNQVDIPPELSGLYNYQIDLLGHSLYVFRAGYGTELHLDNEGFAVRRHVLSPGRRNVLSFVKTVYRKIMPFWQPSKLYL